MNGSHEHLVELATLKAQLDEARKILRARERAAGRMARKSRDTQTQLHRSAEGLLHDYRDWPLIAEASVSQAEAINALDDLAVAYSALAVAASQLAEHVQEGIRQKYYG